MTQRLISLIGSTTCRLERKSPGSSALWTEPRRSQLKVCSHFVFPGGLLHLYLRSVFSAANHMFQYFITIVPTELKTKKITAETHQYSVTERVSYLSVHTFDSHICNTDHLFVDPRQIEDIFLRKKTEWESGRVIKREQASDRESESVHYDVIKTIRCVFDTHWHWHESLSFLWASWAEAESLRWQCWELSCLALPFQLLSIYTCMWF